MGGTTPAVHAEVPSLETLIQRLPDGFVIVDPEGQIIRANNTFLDLAQVGAESAIVGQKLKRWISRPGADTAVILGIVQRHGSVRNMSTQIEGDLGSLTDIEISAVGDSNGSADFVALLLRDVTQRTRAETALRPVGLDPHAGSISLEALVRTSTEAIERSTITEALERTRGHRTAAARYLGLSRQSLHAKLKKYGFDEK
jgi:transcriptional regulator PpsR